MKHYITKILAWVFIALFALVLIVDGLCLLGLPRAWQYLYNGCFFIVILPFLLSIALRDKLIYK